MAISRAIKKKWDAIVVGGGHNGLVAAAYLAKAGKKVCVLERRHLLGGAAVTEEIIPKFHFSRASYVFSLFRPRIIEELELKRHGLHVYPRTPSSFTPTLAGQSLTLGNGMAKDMEEIAKFSVADSKAYPLFNQELEKFVDFFTPMLDEIPPDPGMIFRSSSTWRERLEGMSSLVQLAKRFSTLGKDFPKFIEFLTSPADKILNRWFESDILKSTLATDAIIGAKVSPSTPGSAYVLFHHVMGELNGVKGQWGHVQGGMGGVSKALASSAKEYGAELFTDAPVSRLRVEGNSVVGVTLEDGQEMSSSIVLSNASPTTTFLDLLPKSSLPVDFRRHFEKSWCCESSSTKINVALDSLPNFRCLPNQGMDGQQSMPHHNGTIHFEDSMSQIEEAFLDAQQGHASRRPVIEMNLPTVLDPTIAPKGKHIALLFVQYTPYHPKGESWNDPVVRERFANQVFDLIDQYAPGFKKSILGYDMLTPPDLEKVFGLPKGNIFHGSMGLDQLFWLRPANGYSNYKTPLEHLYLCGAGTHPGGGVMGSPGRNAALLALKELQ